MFEVLKQFVLFVRATPNHSWVCHKFITQQMQKKKEKEIEPKHNNNVFFS